MAIETGFEVGWTNPDPGGSPLSAVHYLVRDEGGAVVVGPRRIDWPAGGLAVSVPGTPGAYTLEVWLEDDDGAEGAPASTRLRFDDTAPVEPLPGAGWIGRAELPHAIRIAHPGGPLPPSGIRGYAISVDREPEGEPCAGAWRCADAETDLRSGVEGDTLWLDLPDGLD